MACGQDHINNCVIIVLLANLYELVNDSQSQDAQVASMITHRSQFVDLLFLKQLL